jgi:hydroxyacylglutathione hydrolase
VLPAGTRVCCTHEYTLSNLKFAAAVEPANAQVQAHVRHCESLRAAGQPTLPSTLALELQINPFLRSREPAVVAAARAQGAASAAPVDVLAAVREWKNHFR